MKDSTRRMRAAASPHKRKHWQAEREKAAAPEYTVQGGMVKLDGKVIHAAGSNAAAWAWIDRHTVAKRYGGGT
jgi:hypothetical protein